MNTRTELFSFAVSLAAIAMAVPAASAQAKLICRWVTEGGKTQMAEVVPDKYKEVAICIDSRKYELSPEQRRAADQRLADDKAKTRSGPAKSPARAASSASPSAPSASQPIAKRPAEVVTESTDCPTWWRLYDESAACLGPFRTTQGATKAGAFDVCNVVASPEPTCGLRSN